MQDWKMELVEKMESTGLKEISIREVALENGISHIKRQDTLDILHAFVKRNPSFKIVQMLKSKTSNESLFVSAVVTELEYETEGEWLQSVGE